MTSRSTGIHSAVQPRAPAPAKTRLGCPVTTMPEIEPGSSVVLPAFHCLIADDVEGHRSVLSSMIVALGGTVELATDGVEAMEAARNRRYDLVLMDVHMPRLDGLSAVRRIREIESGLGRRPSLIFMVTSHDAPPDILTAIGAGADGHISKPVAVADIVSAARHTASLDG